MNINLLPETIMLCRESQVCSFVWGHRGLGKSEGHKTIALGNDWGFIDCRGSQLESSDLRGLPDKKDGFTRYLPPSELPQGHGADATCPACSDMSREEAKAAGIRDNKYCKGIFFLDEINRSEDDVLQAIFQLVLDRAIGEYEMPDGWSVHCAGNFAKGYNTNNFKDPAFLDRFCHLTVSAGEKYVESWIGYFSERYDNDKVLQFCASNKDNLIGAVEGDLGFTIQPSPRSWISVVRVEAACEEHKFSKKARQEVINGLVGPALGASYDRWSCDITPKQIINDGPQPHETVLSGLTRNAFIGLTHGIASKLVGTKTSELGTTKMRNVCNYMLYLCNERSNRDMAVALGRRLVGKESSLSSAMFSNPKMANFARQFAKRKRKQNKDMAKTWIEILTEYEELSEIMQKVTWAG